MADQVILSEVKLTLWDIYRFTQWVICWRFGWPLTILAGVAIWFVYSHSFGHSRWEWNWLNVGGALFLFVLVPYAFFVLPYFALRKHRRRNPALAEPITYVFSDAGIDVSTPSSHDHVSWETLTRVSETSSWFLVYPKTYPTQTIPKRFLSDAEQLAKLRALVRTYAKNAKLQLQG
jgi:hypothetical protein